jgi:signal transduction histidine kinase/ActR/RegA family two-component response regulator
MYREPVQKWLSMAQDPANDPILREAIDSLPCGISVYDPTGRPIVYNDLTRQRFPHMFEAFEKGVTDLIEAQRYAVTKAMPDAPPEKIEAVAQHLADCVRKGETYEVRSPEGKSIQITFREMTQGRKVAVSMDVTELRKRERELKKAQEAAVAASTAKSAFLANMSHEIRTPLNGIMGMAQVMEQTNLDDRQREFLATILESSKTLMALLNDVLDLSKIEAGKFDITPTDASLHHMMRRQLKLWRPRAEEKGLELSLSFDADLPTYLAFDAVRVQQCVSNLVSNAIKFTASGSVDVFAAAKPQADGAHLVEIRVRDTGEGMDAETLGRLFKPFAQADETISRRHGGTGLGLSIVRRLAELMGGTASATSEPGRGSTFRVSFTAKPAKAQPKASAGASPETADVRDALKQSNLRVLLVDDHPINRQVASLFLKPFNMRVVEAVNGVECLAALERETFDIVLLDMHMPVMDGPTAISRIRASEKAWADVPVIALTADAMGGDRERYMAMGMDGYLSKPLAERDLIAEITRVRAGVGEQRLAKAG